MGITQYTLRRPRALQGEVSIAVTEKTRLIIVAQTPPPLDDPFMRDVLRAMMLTEHETLVITPEQQAMLPDPPPCICWCLGLNTPISTGVPDIISPELAELSQNAGAKRTLWQQISDYESHFFTEAS
ncbi:DNA polymerase III subunit psi [Erwinia tracheiphila PSU-1]|nr:DNA polymerase III subunit psi [Erwinia tracheiphila PSU-1]